MFHFQVQRLSVKVIIMVNRLQHEKVYKAQLIVYEEGKLQRVTQQNVYFRGIFSEFVCI